MTIALRNLILISISGLILLISLPLQGMQVARTSAETTAFLTQTLEERLEEGGQVYTPLNPNLSFDEVDWKDRKVFYSELGEMVFELLVYNPSIPEGREWRKGPLGSKIHTKSLEKRSEQEGFVSAWLIARFSEVPSVLISITKTETDRNILLIAAIRADALIEKEILREAEPYLERSILTALKKVEKIDKGEGESLKGVKSFARAVSPSFRLMLLGEKFPGVSEIVGGRFSQDDFVH